jgi:hypothetical protein
MEGMDWWRVKNMRFKTKIAILLVAGGLSFLEFNLIASCGCFSEILRAGRTANYAVLADAFERQPDVVVTAALKP